VPARRADRVGQLDAQGLVASSLAIVRRHVPPPPAAARLRRPLEWGTVARLRELLGDRLADLRTRRRSTDVCAASAADLIAFNRACHGPTRAAFAQLDQPGQVRLASDLATDLERFNRARRHIRRRRGIPRSRRRKGLGGARTMSDGARAETRSSQTCWLSKSLSGRPVLRSLRWGCKSALAAAALHRTDSRVRR
jgi:hypothetical protein